MKALGTVTHQLRSHSDNIETKNYLPSLDAARLLACAGIVAIHVFGFARAFWWIADIGRFAVPFFASTTIFMIAKTLQRQRLTPFSTYLNNRFIRIYVPFLVWTVFYLTLRDVKYAVHTPGRSLKLGLYLFINGSANHLWFLPFIFTVSAVGFLYLKHVVNSALWKWVALVTLLVGGCFVAISASPLNVSDSGDDTLTQVKYSFYLGWRTLPSVIWGFGLAPFFLQLKQLVSNRRFIKWVVLASAIICVFGAVMLNDNVLYINLAGFLLLIAALGDWRGGIVKLMAWAGKYSYGIYLSHMAWVLAFESLLVGNSTDVNVCILLLVFMISFAGSLLTSIVISRLKWCKWVVP